MVDVLHPKLMSYIISHPYQWKSQSTKMFDDSSWKWPPHFCWPWKSRLPPCFATCPRRGRRNRAVYCRGLGRMGGWVFIRICWRAHRLKTFTIEFLIMKRKNHWIVHTKYQQLVQSFCPLCLANGHMFKVFTTSCFTYSCWWFFPWASSKTGRATLSPHATEKIAPLIQPFVFSRWGFLLLSMPESYRLLTVVRIVWPFKLDEMITTRNSTDTVVTVTKAQFHFVAITDELPKHRFTLDWICRWFVRHPTSNPN